MDSCFLEDSAGTIAGPLTAIADAPSGVVVLQAHGLEIGQIPEGLGEHSPVLIRFEQVNLVFESDIVASCARCFTESTVEATILVEIQADDNVTETL
jgi:hypothetical protein